MKKLLFIVPLFLLLWTFSSNSSTPWSEDFSFYNPLDTTASIRPQAVHEQKALLINTILSTGHYRKLPLNDSVSSKVLDNFINDLDGTKMYFLASDIKSFEKFRYKIDDEIRQEKDNLNIAYNIFNVYLKRVYERMDRNQALLKEKFEFGSDEYYETDREKAQWAKDGKELDKEWRKLLKSQMLEAKLNGEEMSSIIDKLQKRYERYRKTVAQTNSEDVFQTYINAITSVYDPHTSYFSPVSAENFNNSMKRSLEGIGAVLSNENDYTVIRSVREGSPAFKSKKLFKGDRIVAVGQGDGSEMVDVVGWRLDDVIQLIRGKQGTIVRLSVLPASEGPAAKAVEVRMVREKITFEEQSSTKQIIEFTKNNKKYRVGVIGIPAFYINFEEYRLGKADYKSTTNDVKKILAELKEEQLDGLVVDLRYNGGGSLKEAIDLTSLFIKSGPVVQVRDANGRINVGETDDFEQVYDGSLVVMVNRFSASASEIFASAIQDYRRGLIVGEATYGKGTVQNVIDLGRYLTNFGDNIGQLNLTLSKYYRITGSTTQNLGVIPDIELPSPYKGDEYREVSQKSTLPADQIRKARFQSSDEISAEILAQLESSFQKRKTQDADLKKLVEDIQKTRRNRDNTKITLNEQKRKKEKEEEKSSKVQIEEENAALNDDEGIGEDSSSPKLKAVESYTALKDLYLKNGVSITTELAELHKKRK